MLRLMRAALVYVVGAAATAVGLGSVATADAYSLLYRALPPGYSAEACVRFKPPPSAVAGLHCSQNSLPGGASESYFFRFPDVDSLTEYFWKVNTYKNRVSLQCPGSANKGSWHNTRTAGGLDCGHAIATDDADIVWASNSDLMLGQAWGPDLIPLFNWWVSAYDAEGF